MHTFLKCVFPCMSTSASLEHTSGTSRNNSFYFSSAQNKITKPKHGMSPQGFCCTKSISWGSPFFHTVPQLLQHLLCSHWALLNGPTLFNFPFLQGEMHCSLCALQLFPKSNLLVSLDAKIT